MAQSFRASGRYERALEEIDRALAADTGNPAYHFLRAQILNAQEQPGEAVQAAARALEGGPQYFAKVLALTEDFYTKQAEIIYQQLLRTGAKEMLAFLGLGNIALYRNQIPQAEAWVGKAATLEPKNRLVLLALGRIELAQGNHAAAKEFLEESKRKGTESSALYSSLGEVYTHLSDWQKAEESYSLALRHERKNIQWRLALANALVQLRRADEAEEKYREILAIDPNFTAAWRGLKQLGRRYY
jgi:tetratricopeptide (TPR) repeat protein